MVALDAQTWTSEEGHRLRVAKFDCSAALRPYGGCADMSGSGWPAAAGAPAAAEVAA
eukprot:gene2531-1223_t